MKYINFPRITYITFHFHVKYIKNFYTFVKICLSVCDWFHLLIIIDWLIVWLWTGHLLTTLGWFLILKKRQTFWNWWHVMYFRKSIYFWMWRSLWVTGWVHLKSSRDPWVIVCCLLIQYDAIPQPLPQYLGGSCHSSTEHSYRSLCITDWPIPFKIIITCREILEISNFCCSVHFNIIILINIMLIIFHI